MTVNFSQWDEDVIVGGLVAALGWSPAEMFCVEFGASDGVSLSNTRFWREQGAAALLIESARTLAEEARASALERDVVAHSRVRPTGDFSIDALVARHLDVSEINLMSVDVDGDDYLIVQHMALRPGILIVEYNPSIPSGWIVKPTETGHRLGCSLAALCELNGKRDYVLAAATQANGIFVRSDLAERAGVGALTAADVQDGTLHHPVVAVSDYDGNVVPIDTESGFYWGFPGVFIGDQGHSVRRIEP